ncbi:RNA polymerase subunit sigma [Pseudomonas endophytica]|uniref:RNA polymerase subunit sigma n=1 Tax=Pseudomonas endophytica TaxID=1563157 RepID=A0A0Q0T051_9PSED|nr:MucB/RseB C-terminal domain-containing protein [Pseudomonas endophytica]KQB52847.1 RNA polymerase subunit sigma [Pseudomonas endophytica]
MRVLPLLPLLLSGLCVMSAQADEAKDWLKRLGEAEQQQSYQGTFVYERNGSFSTHSILHRVQDGKVRERLVQLDGVFHEVVRADGRTQCATGKAITDLGHVADTSARQLNLQNLDNWYALTRAGDSRVAGRPVVVIALTPRDQHRYGVELYLDRETGLPLKSLLIDDKGKLLERFQFTHLDITPPDESQLTPTAQCKAVVAASPAPAVTKPAHAWHSDWLPPGFELISSAVNRDPKTKSEVTSLMYDDGLTRFSVFLEPLKGDAAPDMRLQLGPTVAVSRHLSTPDAEILATVVGEIPLGTAERIALSMRAGKADSSTEAEP